MKVKCLKDGTDNSPPFRAEVKNVLSFTSVQAFCGPESKHCSKDHKRTHPSYLAIAGYGSYSLPGRSKLTDRTFIFHSQIQHVLSCEDVGSGRAQDIFGRTPQYWPEQ
jgi:hypothetical protein